MEKAFDFLKNKDSPILELIRKKTKLKRENEEKSEDLFSLKISNFIDLIFKTIIKTILSLEHQNCKQILLVNFYFLYQQNKTNCLFDFLSESIKN